MFLQESLEGLYCFEKFKTIQEGRTFGVHDTG